MDLLHVFEVQHVHHELAAVTCQGGIVPTAETKLKIGPSKWENNLGRLLESIVQK